MKHALCLAGALLLLIVVWLLIRPDVGTDVVGENETTVVESVAEEVSAEEMTGEGSGQEATDEEVFDANDSPVVIPVVN